MKFILLTSSLTLGLLALLSASPWLERRGDPPPAFGRISYTDEQGVKGNLTRLLDKPVLLSFFYSRCQNDAKCSMTMTKLAALQRVLKAHSMESKFRVLAVTYEPHFDTPDRLRQFASGRGFLSGPDASVLQIGEPGLTALLGELEAPVNFNAGWVNTHGVELILLLPGGHVAGRYANVSWVNEKVVEDLKALPLH